VEAGNAGGSRCRLKFAGFAYLYRCRRGYREGIGEGIGGRKEYGGRREGGDEGDLDMFCLELWRWIWA